MKVKNVVIVNDFNYIQGGATKVAIDTAQLLSNAGIQVYFFSAVSKEDEKIENVEYIATNQNEALHEKNKLKGAINGIYNFKAKKELKKLLKTLNYEDTIIHVHGWTKALSSSVFSIAFKMHFKVVITLHDYFTACPNGGYFNYKENEICTFRPLSYKCIKCNCDSRSFFFKIYRVIRQFVQEKIVKLNKRLEYVISISDFSEKVLKATLSQNTKIMRIYNPIEIAKEQKRIVIIDNDYYLYVGRISKEKGVDVFCEAITKLHLKGIVVGDGDEKQKLEERYPNIEFTGWKNKDEVNAYMKKAKALVFPSKWYEGAPLTILEAASIGLPTLVSKNCAGKEFIIDGQSGFLFDGTSKNLMEVINQYEKSDVDQMSKNTYFEYKKSNFNKKIYCKEIEKCYNQIINEVK